MLVLENDEIRLVLVPEFGARVTSLRDKRSGREWLVAGALEGSEADDAVFGGAAARGWDECFPTVVPTDGAPFGWDGPLRDHGALWGRPWDCSGDTGQIVTAFTTPRFDFRRTLTLKGASVFAAYRLANPGTEKFGFLYSQHMLLAARAGETLGARRLSSLLTDDGADAGRLKTCRALTPVGDLSAATATKLYGQVEGPCEVWCSGPEGRLSIAFASPFLPALGLWGCYGGWPADRPVHQVALEPTTAPAHALTHKSVSWLHPGQGVDWTIRISLTAP